MPGASDARLRLARNYHQQAQREEQLAGEFRAQRDLHVRQLRESDPGHWTYARMAKAIGCSPELIKHIVTTGRT